MRRAGSFGLGVLAGVGSAIWYFRAGREVLPDLAESKEKESMLERELYKSVMIKLYSSHHNWYYNLPPIFSTGMGIGIINHYFYIIARPIYIFATRAVFRPFDPRPQRRCRTFTNNYASAP